MFTRTCVVVRSSAYSRTRTSVTTFTGDYTGNFVAEFTGDYVGNYVGTTIDSGSSVIKTYTLYQRTA